MTVYPSYIPKALKDIDRWVCWKTAIRNGEETKIPVNPLTGENAATDDPATWTNFDEALDYFRNHEHIEGIGFVFTGDGPYVGIDLDYCRDPDSGEIDDWAVTIISRLEGYVEISPSGTGIHIIVKGALPGDRNRSGNVEMYETRRYFTITGRTPTSGDSIDDIPDQQAAVRRVYEEHIGYDETVDPDTSWQQEDYDSPDTSGLPDDDQELLERAKKADNGRKFADLWEGRWQANYPSQSEADLALCTMLAFWTRKDPTRIDRLFRQSGLMRDKWDEDRGNQTYGELTISKALAKLGDDEVYDPHHYDETDSADDTQPTAAGDAGGSPGVEGAAAGSTPGNSRSDEEGSIPPRAESPSERSAESTGETGSADDNPTDQSEEGSHPPRQSTQRDGQARRPPRHSRVAHQGIYEDWYDQVLEFEGSVPPWVEQLKDRMKELEGEVDRNEQRIAYWRARFESLEDEVARLRERVSDLEAELDQSRSRSGTLSPGSSASDRPTSSGSVAGDGAGPSPPPEQDPTSATADSASEQGTDSGDETSDDGFLSRFIR